MTPNLERFIQGLQNLTQITQPPIVSLLVRCSAQHGFMCMIFCTTHD